MPDTRIVVVDDDPDILEFMVDFLGLYGYSVGTVSRSTQALMQIQQQQPDLVVLDYRLDAPPNGCEIFFALRAEPTTAHIPVILYSNEHMILRLHHDEVRSMRGDVLEKPFTMEELLAKIEALTIVMQV